MDKYIFGAKKKREKEKKKEKKKETKRNGEQAQVRQRDGPPGGVEDGQGPGDTALLLPKRHHEQLLLLLAQGSRIIHSRKTLSHLSFFMFSHTSF